MIECRSSLHVVSGRASTTSLSVGLVGAVVGPTSSRVASWRRHRVNEVVVDGHMQRKAPQAHEQVRFETAQQLLEQVLHHSDRPDARSSSSNAGHRVTADPVGAGAGPRSRSNALDLVVVERQIALVDDIGRSVEERPLRQLERSAAADEHQMAVRRQTLGELAERL